MGPCVNEGEGVERIRGVEGQGSVHEGSTSNAVRVAPHGHHALDLRYSLLWMCFAGLAGVEAGHAADRGTLRVAQAICLARLSGMARRDVETLCARLFLAYVCWKATIM